MPVRRRAGTGPAIMEKSKNTTNKSAECSLKIPQPASSVPRARDWPRRCRPGFAWPDTSGSRSPNEPARTPIRDQVSGVVPDTEPRAGHRNRSAGPSRSARPPDARMKCTTSSARMSSNKWSRKINRSEPAHGQPRKAGLGPQRRGRGRINRIRSWVGPSRSTSSAIQAPGPQPRRAAADPGVRRRDSTDHRQRHGSWPMNRTWA